MLHHVDLPYQYTLPGQPRDVHIIPVSGGVDSSALVIVLNQLFPAVDFRYVFTDTKHDEPEIYQALDRLEEILGIHIERLIPKLGLLDLCRSWGDFLPGYNSRYCTKNLKIKPFNAWLEQFRQEGVTVHAYIGIRADEDRTGIISQEDWVETHMPMKCMGLQRVDVFRIVEESGLGIPRYYQTRTRSGCSCCHYSRNQELIGNMRRHPQVFYEAELIEQDKLNATDQTRWHRQAVNLSQETRIARNHLGYPVPERIDNRTAARCKPVEWAPSQRMDNQKNLSLFDEEPVAEVWAMVEFMVHPGIGGTGVWRQEFVTYSRTRSGIQRQAHGFYWHRLATAPVLGVTREEMIEELRLAIFRMHFPRDLLDVEKPGAGSYVWKTGVSYRQLRHVVSFIERTLMVEGMKRQLQEYAGARQGTWRYEQYEVLQSRLADIKDPYGVIMGMDLYVPPTEAPEEDEREITCLACSL